MEHDPDWSIRMTAGIGERVARLREKKIDADGKKMTVQALADRCAELGLPLGRVTITKLEGGKRQAITPGELMVLAAALEVPPIELLFDVSQGGWTEVLPGVITSPWQAVLWFSGKYKLTEAVPGRSFIIAMPPPGEETDVGLMERHFLAEAESTWYERLAIEAAREAREAGAEPDTKLTERAEYRRVAADAAESSLASIRAEMRRRGFKLPYLGPDLAHVDERLLPGPTTPGVASVPQKLGTTRGDEERNQGAPPGSGAGGDD